ncbi:MAG: ribosome biogenesis GTPase YqeH [Defluviitaleaceae bacterium]|nr:ribosome biogenesis GTPase YqeH [Defluviitaleaceae bacterium]
MEALNCIGCGVLIQTDDKEQVGYTPASSLNKGEAGIVYCQRCFKLKHYNEIMDTTLTNDDFLKILQGIAKQDALVVNLIDVFDVTGTIVKGLIRHIGGNDLIVAANKIDLLPRSVNPGKVKHWLNKEVRDMGMTPLEIAVISSEKGHGIDELMTLINQYRKGRDVYIVGCTNVGKSTFINRLIRQYAGESETLITTSYFPGTTLDLIEIPLDKGSSIIDTPGIINEHQLVHYIDKKDFKIMTPKKEIKPGVYQLNANQTLYVGGLIRFDFVTGSRASFISYFSNELKIHRTKLDNAKALWENHAGTLLTPVIRDEDQLRPFKRHVFNLRDEKLDIVISGLGFITAPSGKQEVHVHAPVGVGVFIRPSIF